MTNSATGEPAASDWQMRPDGRLGDNGWKHSAARSSRRLCLAFTVRNTILGSRLGVPMGVRRTVLRDKWTVFLVVFAAVLATNRFLKRRFVAGPSRGPTLRRGGFSPRHRQRLPSTEPDRSRQHAPSSPALSGSARAPRPASQPVQGSGHDAPRVSRVAGQPTFSHCKFDSTHEILLFLIRPRLAPGWQIAFRPVLRRSAQRRGPHGRSRADLLAEDRVFPHGRFQEAVRR